MTLMRHTDPKLTLNTYTDLVLLDTAGAMESLPALRPEESGGDAAEVHTGTDERTIEAEGSKVLTKSSVPPVDSSWFEARKLHTRRPAEGNRAEGRDVPNAVDGKRLRQKRRASDREPKPGSLVRPAGFEPAASSSGGWRSNPG